MKTLCSEVMRNEIEHIGAGATVADVARKMRDEIVGFLPICDEHDRVVGIVTDRDIVVRVVAHGHAPERTPVGAVMSRDLIACRPGDTLEHATELMTKHQKSRMLITDPQGKLCGVLSISDVAQSIDPVRGAALLRSVSARELRVRRPITR